MARIEWDKITDRFVESGVDRGVLYPGVSRGVAWNGLTEVTGSAAQKELQKFYIDGVMYYRRYSEGEYAGIISALTYPEELEYLMGLSPTVEGILLDSQEPKPFGLSYRTYCGPANAPQSEYRIHLVYEALAYRTSVTHSTISSTPDAETMQWTYESMPTKVPGYKPTSHLIFDTRIVNPEWLKALELILYGGYGTDPRLPSITEILSIKDNFDLVRINKNETTGLNTLTTSTTPDLIGDLDTGFFTETRPTRLLDLPIEGLHRLEP